MNLQVNGAVAAAGGRAEDLEQRFLISSVSWPQYVALREMFDDRPSIRMTYLEGTLEIMSPSNIHGQVGAFLADLLRAYAVEKRVKLYHRGLVTFRNEAQQRGA